MVSKTVTRHYPVLFVIPGILLFSLFFVLPSLAGLITSFTDWSIYAIYNPAFNGITNFQELFRSANFRTAIMNTIYFTIVTTVVGVVVGYFLAILLNMPLKFKMAYRAIVFAPCVINPIVISLIFSALYHPTNGPINVFLRKIGFGFLAQNWLTDPKMAMMSICFMSIWMGVGIFMVIFLAGLQSVPQSYYEAATIDGAGSLHKFLYITLPLTTYSLAINTILSLIGGANVFAQVYGLTNGGPAGATEVYGTFIFKSFSEGLFGYSSAAGLIFTVVIGFVCFATLALFRRWEVEY